MSSSDYESARLGYNTGVVTRPELQEEALRAGQSIVPISSNIASHPGGDPRIERGASASRLPEVFKEPLRTARLAYNPLRMAVMQQMNSRTQKASTQASTPTKKPKGPSFQTHMDRYQDALKVQGPPVGPVSHLRPRLAPSGVEEYIAKAANSSAGKQWARNYAAAKEQAQQ